MMYMKTTIIVILLYFIYDDVLFKLVMDWWNDPNYSHGFIVPIFSSYILWQKKDELKESYKTKKPNIYGLLIIIFGLIVLLIGKAASELYMQRFSLIVMISGIVLLLWGTKIFRISFPALAFLIFMIPLPYLLYDAVAFPLKLFATKCATISLYLLNIPVIREGNIIYLANTTLEVADACSGIRSLFSLLAVGTVLACMMLKNNMKRVLLVLTVFPIAIIANASRVIATGILAHFYGGKVAKGFFHEFSGLLIFIISFLLLGFIGKMIGRRSSPA